LVAKGYPLQKIFEAIEEEDRVKRGTIIDKNLAIYETVPKIKVVILSKAKNLIIFFSSQKIKKEILRTKVLRMTRKGKLIKILEHSLYQLENN